MLDKADDEGPAEIDDQRAIRKLGTEPSRCQQRYEVANQGPDSSAESDEQRTLHVVGSSLIGYAVKYCRAASAAVALRLLGEQNRTRRQPDDALSGAAHDPS